MKTQQTSNEKYLAMMKSMNETGNAYKMKHIQRHFMVSNSSHIFMERIGIIEKLETGVYRWSGGKPTKATVLRLKKEMNKNVPKKANKPIAEAISEKPIRRREKTKHRREVSVLWGAFKIVTYK